MLLADGTIIDECVVSDDLQFCHRRSRRRLAGRLIRCREARHHDGKLAWARPHAAHRLMPSPSLRDYLPIGDIIVYRRITSTQRFNITPKASSVSDKIKFPLSRINRRATDGRRDRSREYCSAMRREGLPTESANELLRHRCEVL